MKGSILKEIESQYNRIREIHAVQAINKAATVPLLVDPTKQFKCIDETENLKQNEENVYFFIN